MQHMLMRKFSPADHIPDEYEATRRADGVKKVPVSLFALSCAANRIERRRLSI